MRMKRNAEAKGNDLGTVLLKIAHRHEKTSEEILFSVELNSDANETNEEKTCCNCCMESL